MIKIDIVSGFLGAGKTTLIKKLLKEALNGTKVVLIENEFGEIGIDGGFLKDAGIEIKEMNSGCICCSLVGDFGASLKEVMETYSPDRILIEPSGVGKLSDVIKAVQEAAGSGAVLNSSVAVVDAAKCKMYIKNFGEFFIDQISHAGTIILSRTDKVSEEKISKCVELLRGYNAEAVIVTTPWEQLEGQVILDTIEKIQDLEKVMMEELHAHQEHDHCDCHDHDHHDHDHGDCHDHDHHDHCDCHDHDHDHIHHGHEEHGEGCTCGCHDHEHHHHHADEVFTSFGMETPVAYGMEELESILEKLEDESVYGMVLRAKGMVAAEEGGWLYFDYVPGERNVRKGKADVTGKICVIGAQLQEENLKKLWKKEGKA